MLCLLLSCFDDSLLSLEIDVIVVVLQVSSRVAYKWRCSRKKRSTAWHARQPRRGLLLARVWPVSALCSSSTQAWLVVNAGMAKR